MNEFEKVANEIDKRNLTNETSQECAIEWIKNCRTATVTFPGGTKYATKIRKLAEEHPEEVKIRSVNKDGSIVSTIPTSYIKISPKRQGREMSEEEKEAARERLMKYRKSKN